MPIKMSVTGLAKTQQFLVAKTKHADSLLKQGIAKAGRLGRNEVKESIAGRKAEPTSVDTGRFMNSVAMEQFDYDAVVFTPLDYPEGLEFGTSRIKARHHFANSIARNRDKFRLIIRDSLSQL